MKISAIFWCTRHGQAALEHISEGYKWIVDIDLEKFFDRVNHDKLMSLIARRVGDKRLLKLIRRYLESGITINGVETVSEDSVSLYIINCSVKSTVKQKPVCRSTDWLLT